jgi:hypothetical protein
MKNRRKFYIGISLLTIGITIFVFYYTTGNVLFHSFDEVTQIEAAKIISYDKYVANGRYELILLVVSLLSFFSGAIILFINKKMTKRECH